MESWSYVSDDGVINSSTNPLVRSKTSLLGWESSQTNFGNNVLVSGQQPVENQSFEELKDDSSIYDVMSCKVGGGRVLNPVDALPGEDESASKLSGSKMDSNSRDSSLIDLKLGRFTDLRDAHSSKVSMRVPPILSSSESSTPPKRIRASSANSKTAFCQVYGCNKDLSSSKDYHKRHKVCEAHTKTAKVIVNGIEQRFCQQCSRFHLLPEFDDAKRSCRKRLAGHNERRRKPQVSIQSGSARRFLHSSNGIAGSRFHGTALTATSFICQDILPSGFLQSDKYGIDECYGPIKVEDKNDYRSLSIPMTNGHLQLHSKPLFTQCDIGTPNFSFHEHGGSSETGHTFTENTNLYPLTIGGPHTGSRSLFLAASSMSEVFNVMDPASTVQGLRGDSGRALSLLSSQSHNSSSHSTGVHMSRPLINPYSQSNNTMSQLSETLIGVSSEASTSKLPNKFISLGMDAVEGCHMAPILTSEDNDDVNFQVMDGIFRSSDLTNVNDRLYCEGSPTIDLLQLSSQLERVEHQRQSMHGNNAFCSLRTT